MALTIKVPAWGKEVIPDTDPVEYWDVELEETKELACGKGIAFFAFGRYFVWGEIIEIREEAQLVKIKLQSDESKTGWVHLSTIKDCIPHDVYVNNGVQIFLGANPFAEADKIENFTMAEMVNGAKIFGD